MGNWRGVATFLLFPALIMGVFTFAVIIPCSSQADSAELAILYHVYEISNHLVTMIFVSAAIVAALLDIGDQLRRRSS
jgi:hypothetical protein